MPFVTLSAGKAHENRRIWPVRVRCHHRTTNGAPVETGGDRLRVPQRGRRRRPNVTARYAELRSSCQKPISKQRSGPATLNRADEVAKSHTSPR